MKRGCQDDISTATLLPGGPDGAQEAEPGVCASRDLRDPRPNFVARHPPSRDFIIARVPLDKVGVDNCITDNASIIYRGYLHTDIKRLPGGRWRATW